MSLDICFVCRSLASADPLVNSLNILIQSGKLPKDCIYYKFVDNTVRYALVDWSKKNDFQWDKDVLEFFQSIKYLGGAATAKFVRGPCHHGTGRGGIKSFMKWKYHTKAKQTSSLVSSLISQRLFVV